jgi:hypothetical protein
MADAVRVGVRTYDCARGVDPRHSHEGEDMAEYDLDGSRHIKSCDRTIGSPQEAVLSEETTTVRNEKGACNCSLVV